GGYVEPLAVGVGGERFALDVLHHEVGPPVGQAAAIDQVGDAGVFELRQDAALFAEARDQAATYAVVHDLDRHPLFELAVAAFAQVHRAHAAAADLADDAIDADPGGCGIPRAQGLLQAAEIRTGLVIERQQPLDFRL